MLTLLYSWSNFYLSKLPYMIMKIFSCRVFIISLFLIMLLFAPSVISSKIIEKEKKKSYDLRSWIEGPVRYISTFDEVKAFKSLKTDKERTYFIYKFWRRRDPSPLTLKNEFRERFWQRVLFANQRFDESAKPGWRTDRGKIYIMAGPPNDREVVHDPEPSLGIQDMHSSSSSGHRGIERWIYEGFPSLKASSYIVVAFYKDATGEYRLSYNPEHFSKMAPGIIPPDENFPDPMAFAEGASPEQSTGEEDTRREESDQRLDAQIARTEEIERLNAISQFAYDLAEMVDTPAAEEILQERISTFEFFEPISESINFSIFQDANDQPYLNLSVHVNLREYYDSDIPDHATIPMSLFGNLKEVSSQQNEFLFTSDPFVPNHIIREKDNILLSSSLSIPPGEYDAVVGVQELLTGRISLFSGRIKVPIFNRSQITLSDPILASKIESIEEGSYEGSSPIPGNLIVTPKAHSSYSKEEDFSVYFQIYEVGKDPSGKISLNISYQFYRWVIDHFEKIGQPIVFQNIETQERGWSFPLQKWPEGKFKLEITVKDNITELTDSKGISFEITGP